MPKPRSSPNLDHSQPLSPDLLDELEAMGADKAAEFVTARAKFIDRADRTTFAEKGLIAEYVETRRLWEHVENPDTGHPCQSQNEWIDTFCPFSRASWFDAKRRWKELEDVPAADRVQISRGNLIVMQKLSTAVRKDAKVIEAAKTLPETAFVEMVGQRFPDQHLEHRKEMKIKPEASAHKVIEEGIRLAMILGAKSKEEAVEMAFAELIDAHREEYDAMIEECA